MKKNPKLFYLLLAAITAGIVALDQWTKWLTERAFESADGSGFREAIPGLFHFTRVGNEGGAWGIFGGHTWLFVTVLVLFVAVLGLLIYKKWLTKRFELLCLAGILGGGIGNLVDRLATGTVTDMIAFDFVRFPVFNVADCFITVGCILLLVFVLFFDRPKKNEDLQDDAINNGDLS